MLDNRFFSDTPFALMADPVSATRWAGRPKQLDRIERIVRRLSRRNESSLDVVWANFGAGKTHTLFYLAHRIVSTNSRRLCVVVEVPEQVRNFLDLYQRIAGRLQNDTVAQTLLKPDLDGIPEDLRRAATALVHGGPEEKRTASQWLCAEKVDGRKLRQLTGIGCKIDGDSIACDILSSILTGLGASGGRFCLMLDEFQRIERLAPRVKSSVTSSLRSLLSKNPRNFSLFLAIASRLEKTALAQIPAELQTILALEGPLALPEMDEDEAIQFVRDRLRSFRPPGFSGDPFAPMGLSAIKHSLEVLAKTHSSGLSPRIILQTMAYLYDEMPNLCEPLDTASVDELLTKLGNRDQTSDE